MRRRLWSLVLQAERRSLAFVDSRISQRLSCMVERTEHSYRSHVLVLILVYVQKPCASRHTTIIFHVHGWCSLNGVRAASASRGMPY